MIVIIRNDWYLNDPVPEVLTRWNTLHIIPRVLHNVELSDVESVVHVVYREVEI